MIQRFIRPLVQPLVRAVRREASVVQGEARIAAVFGCACVRDEPCSLIARGQCGAAEGFAVVSLCFTPQPEPLRLRKPEVRPLDMYVPCGLILHELNDLRRESATVNLRLPHHVLEDGEFDLGDVVELSAEHGVIFQQGEA